MDNRDTYNNCDNNINEKDIPFNQADIQQDVEAANLKDVTEHAAEADEVTELKEKVKQEHEEAEKNHNLYLRALAEAENTRKRAAREREEYIKYAALPFVKKLLPVLDDMERADNMMGDAADFASLSKGLELISKKMHEILKNEGVEMIKAAEEPFDPQYHQPLLVEENSEYPENTVIEELQKGYKMHDRVIRPSLVKVSK